MLVVIAYDVANDRRRVRLHTLLLGYGTAVQESLFECDLSERETQQLQRRIAGIIRSATDAVRIYRLCRTCAERMEDASGRRPAAPPEAFTV